jgi:diphthamide biosynthesis protein 4
MAYTKDYYHILRLPAPSWTSKQQATSAELRRAYKLALLAAHPDKASAVAAATTNATAKKTQPAYTVDDVKEAYTTLANATTKSSYDDWFLKQGGGGGGVAPTRGNKNRQWGSEGETPLLSSDFILGLELLDLGDFEEAGDSGQQQQGQQQQMTWTRSCRCGADKGFTILEEELEDAESRGEKEVLVGCSGCSLWVRVGFEVEVEAEGG